MNKPLERWDCQEQYGEMGYSIVPFGEKPDYYGLYVWHNTPLKKGAAGNILDFTKWDSEHTGYLRPDEAACHSIHIGCAVASAIGLPPPYQFVSVEACKDFVAETCSARMEWKSSPA
jgi:hypothetical protein